MQLFADASLGAQYKSRSQQARRITEDWVAQNLFCLGCEADQISPTSANTESCDFRCPQCKQIYELKSKCGVFSSRVLDGAYSPMIDAIRKGRTPNFLLLEYSRDWAINGLRAVHHSLITESAIIRRRPLAVTAVRAGWVGCSISLAAVASQAQINVVNEGILQPRSLLRERFAQLQELGDQSLKDRTWTALTLLVINKMGKDAFSLPDIYNFEAEFRKSFPNNQHIRPKIRQQLQRLRDAGFIRFLGDGRYEHIRDFGR